MKYLISWQKIIINYRIKKHLEIVEIHRNEVQIMQDLIHTLAFNGLFMSFLLNVLGACNIKRKRTHC
jgi:hypothetical protein